MFPFPFSQSHFFSSRKGDNKDPNKTNNGLSAPDTHNGECSSNGVIQSSSMLVAVFVFLFKMRLFISQFDVLSICRVMNGHANEAFPVNGSAHGKTLGNQVLKESKNICGWVAILCAVNFSLLCRFWQNTIHNDVSSQIGGVSCVHGPIRIVWIQWNRCQVSVTLAGLFHLVCS